MSFTLLGFGLAFAIYLVGSSALSLAVGLAFPLLEQAAARLDPRWRALLLFGLGVLPALGGAVLVLGLVLPAWLAHEPRGGEERPGPVLLLLAAAGLTLVTARLVAALLDQLRTQRTVRHWTTEGQPLPGLPLEATRFPHDFPVAALSGLVRPRLLLADRLLQALSPEELEAVVAHELSHHAAHDNLKRLLLRASPDPLALSPAGAALRRAFDQAAEAAADRDAANRVPPLGLASALVKVAALVPPGQRLEMSAVTLHHDGPLEARVRALVAAHDVSAAKERSRPRPGRGPIVLGIAALAALVLLVLGSAAPTAVHDLLEALVHLLS